MNEIFLSLGIEAWKPALTSLLLPPVPLLLLVLVGARLMFRRRLLAWFVILIAVLTLWLSFTTAAGSLLRKGLLHPPPALREADIAEFKRAPRTAIVVLGGGRYLLSPEYGVSNLHAFSLERLRYGVWLSRETGLPLAFSGGVGHGAAPGISEAEIAARIAEREFGRPLKWTETESRDTRENALKTVALLKAQGIQQIVLVTHDFHMPRALRNFERAAEGSNIKVVPAPMGLPASGHLSVANWLPSTTGVEETRNVLREWLGMVAGS
jgi:uncharacterized SAM-binding protein YcdF (DUF218 family)